MAVDEGYYFENADDDYFFIDFEKVGENFSKVFCTETNYGFLGNC